MPEVDAWQNRALDPIYFFLLLDAIHYKVKEEQHYTTKAVYIVLAITMESTIFMIEEELFSENKIE